MAAQISPGHVGNLSTEQEEKVQQLWKLLIESWERSEASPVLGSIPNGSTTSVNSTRRFSILSRSSTQVKEEPSTGIPPKLMISLKNLKAGANEISAVQSLLPKFPGQKLPAAYLSLLKQDHPDSLLLRYLRAEKWDVPKAWIKLVSALNWRTNKYKVDEQVMLTGEPHALETSKSKDASTKKDGEGFMRLLSSGEGHVHGTDKEGRPILVIRVKLHEPSGQTSKAMNDFVIHLLETIRLTLTPPVETMTIVFDMAGFGISNWDLTPVKFIIDTFQSNYPECLGNIIFYNAPWVFSGLWRMVKGLLDPVVAAKVHFLSGADELQQIISKPQMIKELGGDEAWEFEFLEPRPDENEKLNDTATRDKILAERKDLGQELFAVTSEWTQNPKDEAVKSRREESALKLRENYWALDPYIRSRTMLDRTGVISVGGNINFYPTKKDEADKAPVANGQPAETSTAEQKTDDSNDVD